MFFRYLSILPLLAAPALPRVLRVCADPNNLPFSNNARQGFENRLAETIAADLGDTLEYTWWQQRKTSVEKSLKEGRCDLLFGVPSEVTSVLTTKPYYRSTYVFVSRRDRHILPSSLYDTQLDKYRIGIHVVGNGYAPPATILARRGLANHLVGFTLVGHTGESNPPARLIDAVIRGDLDMAIAWGPLAGYFAKQADVPLDITAITPQAFAGTPFTFAMSAAVRKDDSNLLTEIDRALVRNCRSIQSLLNEYGIPQVLEDKPPCESSQQPSASLR